MCTLQSTELVSSTIDSEALKPNPVLEALEERIRKSEDEKRVSKREKKIRKKAERKIKAAIRAEEATKATEAERDREDEGTKLLGVIPKEETRSAEKPVHTQEARKAEEATAAEETDKADETRKDEEMNQMEEAFRTPIAEPEEQLDAEQVRWAAQETRILDMEKRMAKWERIWAEQEKTSVSKDKRLADVERILADKGTALADMKTRLAEVERKLASYDGTFAGTADETLRDGQAHVDNLEETGASCPPRMADEGRDIQDQTASEAKNDAPCVQIDTTLSQVTHEDAKQQGRASIQPVAWPTSQQISTAKTKTQYTEGAFHIATAGSSGSGKSSLINAFRGLSNRDNRAAPTGFVETTRVIGRYEDPDPKRPLVWYDMPSIGTLEVPDSQHFNDEGLFVFDCVVVLFDHRLTEQDVALLRYCAHFQIPSYIVRSKSDAQIGAIEREMRVANADDEGEEEDGLEAVHVSRIGEYEEARGRYMRETNESVHRTLAQAGLPVQTVYFVARDTLRKVIKESLRKHSGNPLQNILRTNSDTPANVGKPSRDNRLEEKVLHERHLLEDMIQTGYGRRQKK